MPVQQLIVTPERSSITSPGEISMTARQGRARAAALRIQFVCTVTLVVLGSGAGCHLILPYEPVAGPTHVVDGGKDAARDARDLAADGEPSDSPTGLDLVPGEAACQPRCSGKICGASDECGGTCTSGSGCCTPSCGSVLCGDDDGCGGTCVPGSGCCVPSCTNKICGASDECGGTCTSGSGCCTPSCNRAVCGANDGCSGTCYGDHGDPCVGVANETWRCVISNKWGLPISQVCRQYSWQTFALDIVNCDGCCGAYSDGCAQKP